MRDGFSFLHLAMVYEEGRALGRSEIEPTVDSLESRVRQPDLAMVYEEGRALGRSELEPTVDLLESRVRQLEGKIADLTNQLATARKQAV